MPTGQVGIIPNGGAWGYSKSYPPLADQSTHVLQWQPVVAPNTLLWCSNRTGNFEIYAQSFAGNPTLTSLTGTRQQLTNDPTYHSWQPMVSPDRSRITINRTKVSSLGANSKDSAAGLPFSELWFMYADGSGLTRLLGPANTVQNADGSFWNIITTAHWIDDDTIQITGGPTANAISQHASIVIDARTGQIITTPYNATNTGLGLDPLDCAPVYRTPGSPQVNDTGGFATVAVASDAADVSTWTGAATLNINTPVVGFPNYGSFQINTTLGPAVVTYTGRGATTFTGCNAQGFQGIIHTNYSVIGIARTQSAPFLFVQTSGIAGIVGVYMAPLHQIDPFGTENGPHGIQRITRPVTDGHILDNDPIFDPTGKWVSGLRKYDNSGIAGTWGDWVQRTNTPSGVLAVHHLIGPVAAAPDITIAAGSIWSRPAFSQDGTSIFSHFAPAGALVFKISRIAFNASTGIASNLTDIVSDTSSNEYPCVV